MSAKFTRKVTLARHKIISAQPCAYFFYLNQLFFSVIYFLFYLEKDDLL